MKKLLVILLLVLCLVAVAGFAVFLFGTTPTPGDSAAIPHYLFYDGTTSKIFLIDADTTYCNANESYVAPDGQVVEKGTPLFVVTMTLRNDYTSDNPAPPLHNQDQTSPADGTAYLYLTAQLYDKAGVLNATDVSVSDFSLASVSGSGFVLSSGETAIVKIYIATPHTDIDKYDANLYFLGDCIPSGNT
jgi:hypothetical protein